MEIYSLQIFLVSIIAGILGSILGLGGGIIIIPALTLMFQVDIKYLTDIPEYEIRKMGTSSSGISYHPQRL